MANLFHLDPLVVLDEPDEYRQAVRVAAARFIIREQKRQSK